MDQEEVVWLRSAVNDLNNLLQVAQGAARLLQNQSSARGGLEEFSTLLQTTLDRATDVTGLLASRLSGNQPQHKPQQSIVRPPSTFKGIEIQNPGSTQELIMLIDDEPLITTTIGTILVDAGYRVVTAIDPFRALEIFREIKDKVDLIILDFTLPIMNGEELFNELRQVRPNIPVVLSSGYAEQSIVGSMLCRGLRGFLPKPYTETKLLEQLRSTLTAVAQEKACPVRSPGQAPRPGA